MTVATNREPATTPTAIEPSRVLILNDDEQHLLLQALGALSDYADMRRLHGRIAFGDEYVNEVDELTRVTLRKRRLEEETRRANKRIETLEPAIVEQWAAEAQTGIKHAGTGATLRLDSKIWAKVEVNTDGMSSDEEALAKAEAKAMVGGALMEAGLGHLVRPDFNLNTLSAVFREQIRAYREGQAELPEHKREPRTAESFLPEPLRGLLRIDDTPHIQVRA